MLVLRRKVGSYRTMRGWVFATLRYAGAIIECEEHGHILDRGDPHASDLAIEIALDEGFPGAAPDQIRAEIEDIMRHVGDACPECKRFKTLRN